MADNEIRLNVTAVQSEPLNVCVNQVPMNPVNVENTYKGLDYNLLRNKPSIEGKTIEGDNTVEELIGFDKEYVDNAILTTNAKIDDVEQELSDRIDAISVSTDVYTKQEIDNKITVIEADIDANADAILKTRGDFMESDSELQQQINAHAEELTTQRNDIDGLGDQVAGIEGKIPETATDANPLVTKQDLLDTEMDIRDDVDTKDGELQEQLNAQATAIAGKQDTLTAGEGISIDGNVISATGGGGEVPDNVYTQDNLIAGNNISFEDKEITVGLDNNTLALFHFDDDTLDSSNHKGSGVYSGITTPESFIEGKFGKAINVIKSNNESFVYKNDAFSTADSLTLDYWIYLREKNTSLMSNVLIVFEDNTMLRNMAYYNSGNKYLWIIGPSGTIYDATCNELKLNDWNHLAVQIDKTQTCMIFVNGKLITTTTTNVPAISGFSEMQIESTGEQYIDEVRFSNVTRYDGDFTPETEAYNDVSETKTVKAVNAIIPEVDIPEGIYTQTNLLGGKDIEIIPEPVEGGIDEYTVALWHFDGNSNWVDAEGNEHPTDLSYQYFNFLNDYKFGSGSAAAPNTAGVRFSAATLENNYGMKRVSLGESFTIDWWLYWGASSYTDQMKLGFTGSSNGFDLSFPIGASAGSATLTARVSGQSYSASFVPSENGVVENSWNHLAIEYYVQDNQVLATAFVNGKPAASTNFVASSSEQLDTFQFGCYPNSQKFDEVRISKTARYKGVDFSDSLPTEAYRVAEPTGNYVINNLVTKTSQLTNDSGFLTELPDTGLPDNVYTAENLVSGDNITFTPKKAVFDADIVGSPVISDNYEVSGFSDSNYLKFVDPIASASKYDSFEIGFAFKANTLNTENAGIYDGGSSGGSGYRITITTDGKIRARIITTSSGSYGIDLTGSTTLETGKKYYGKVNYSSETGYTLSLKEEGGEWAVDASTTTTTTPYSNGERDIWIGDNQATGGYSFDGTIYLPEMYINIDGKRVWTGFLPDRTVVSADNVYTKTNLLGGKDIEIVPEPVEGGIDEYTVAIFHYDDPNNPDKNSAVGGVDPGVYANIYTDFIKFGEGSSSGGFSYYVPDLKEDDDWTVDQWCRFDTNTLVRYSQGIQSSSGDSTSSTTTLGFYLNRQVEDCVRIYCKGTLLKSTEIDWPTEEWIHVATEKYGNYINCYLNGKKIISYEGPEVKNSDSTRMLFASGTGNYPRTDELRLSKIARYKGENFTPPTKAYSLAEPTGNYVVNNLVTKTSQLTNDSGFLTEMPADIDYVVENYQNGTEWYKIYKSGWVEQGGLSSGASVNHVVTFLKPFADTSYTLIATHYGANYNAYINTATETSFQVYQNIPAFWRACGQGAE